MKKTTSKPPTATVTAPPTPAVQTSTVPSDPPPTVKAIPIPATALSMFRVPDGWSLIKLDLAMTPNGPEILNWETLTEDGPAPKSHVDNYFRVNAARLFLYPME